MRNLNETEMSVAAGGVSRPPIPWGPPEVKPPEKNDWWICLLLLEPEICDDASHENPCI